MTESLPEVKVINVKLTFSDESRHNFWCFVCNIILFIISGVTWLNDNKNLPIVSWNFFCESLVYVTCNTSNWSPEGTDFSNSFFETNWSSDRKLEKIANKVVNLAIFEFIMWKWSRDPSFWSINRADNDEHIFITKKSLRNQKLRKY